MDPDLYLPDNDYLVSMVSEYHNGKEIINKTKSSTEKLKLVPTNMVLKLYKSNPDPNSAAVWQLTRNEDLFYGFEIVKPELITKIEVVIMGIIAIIINNDIGPILNITDLFPGIDYLVPGFSNVEIKFYGDFDCLIVFIKQKFIISGSEFLPRNEIGIFKQFYSETINSGNKFKIETSTRFPLLNIKINPIIECLENRDQHDECKEIIENIYGINILHDSGFQLISIMPSELIKTKCGVEFKFPVSISMKKLHTVHFEILGMQNNIKYLVTSGHYNFLKHRDSLYGIMFESPFFIFPS